MRDPCARAMCARTIKINCHRQIPSWHKNERRSCRSVARCNATLGCGEGALSARSVIAARWRGAKTPARANDQTASTGLSIRPLLSHHMFVLLMPYRLHYTYMNFCCKTTNRGFHIPMLCYISSEPLEPSASIVYG